MKSLCWGILISLVSTLALADGKPRLYVFSTSDHSTPSLNIRVIEGKMVPQDEDGIVNKGPITIQILEAGKPAWTLHYSYETDDNAAGTSATTYSLTQDSDDTDPTHPLIRILYPNDGTATAKPRGGQVGGTYYDTVVEIYSK